jgi:hypothetical protein
MSRTQSSGVEVPAAPGGEMDMSESAGDGGM